MATKPANLRIPPGLRPSLFFQSEKSFQAQVMKFARLMGWRVYHVFDSRRSEAGFPDLVLVKRPSVLFVELKTQRGRLSPEQKAWIEDLKACGEEVFVWRPSDWQEIERNLS